MEVKADSLITSDEISLIVNRLLIAYHPNIKSIYLFGSYAWGTPNEDSDLDIMVVLKESEQNPHKRVVKGYKSLRGIMTPTDLIVYTQEEYQKLLEDEFSFCNHIVKEGKKLYEC
ncbi:nucleotidyltransferase-like protein [Orenia metallireducens]|jgi:predicted nucleotidyltransferase|uniref:Nucleotidyltransferase domain-containing protein n=1 Tax=Orenia metallireducens TaxID=1413210 RepID=A0A285IDN0_9FIRM|nr:nucleotidyltransferase domain-containing protein [Orenia metallireducens]PRX19657.1 nucleotidyltransferase-like protein [Orenia metallireducens]SNY46033.1 Nucleotidyltransferase domain-containing protein [Orenia metallireducens]